MVSIGKIKNVVVLGWYNHNNLGDECFKKAFESIYTNFDMDFVDIIDESLLYDFAILGGGDVVNSSNLKMLNKLNCEKIALSVSITENSICDELSCLKHIYVRDTKSLEILHKHNIFNCTYLPDVVLTLIPNKENGKELITKIFKKENSDMYENVYAIVVNSHLIGNRNSTYKDRNKFLSFTQDLSQLIDDTNASFIFIPFSTGYPWDDRASNSWVNSNCIHWKKNVVIYDELNIQDSLDIISACNLMISSRYHASIFSYISEIPFITIGFHDKFKSFCEDFKLPYLNYYDYNYSNLISQLNNSINTNKTKNLKNEYQKIFHV